MTQDRTGWSQSQLAIVLAIGLAFSLGVLLKWGPLNGIYEMSKWEWAWRNLDVLKTAFLLAVPLLVLAWVLWRNDKGARVGPLLAVLVLCNLALQILQMAAGPEGLHILPKIVASSKDTSYFTDALAIQRVPQWLAHFHQQNLHNHAMTHPPAPILYYYVFVKMFGTATGSLAGAYTIAVAASLGVLMVYAFSALWTADRQSRLVVAAFYALVPAIVAFFPEFDQIYPIFAMAMILFWVRALDGGVRYAVLLGLLLFACLFSAYNLLTVGAFLAYYTLYWLWRQEWALPSWKSLVLRACVVLAACAGVYLLLWIATGYNPVLAFRKALSNQARIAAHLRRSHIRCAIYDPYDFLLGTGFVALPILFFYCWRNVPRFNWKRIDLVLTAIGLATVLTIDLSGVLRAETARVWLFLQPLAIVPVGLELARLRWPWIVAAFAVQWWILVCVVSRMSFIAL